MPLDVGIRIRNGCRAGQVQHHYIRIVDLLLHARLVGRIKLSLLKRPYIRRMNGRKIVMSTCTIRK